MPQWQKYMFRVSVDTVQLVNCWDGVLKVAGSSPPCATVFLPTKLACWYTSLQVEVHNYKDQSVTNQIMSIEYPGLRPDSYL